MKKIMIGCLVLVCVMVCAWAQDKAAPADPDRTTVEAKVAEPLGANTNPVRCDMPSGQRAYLSRLRGPDGKPPRFHRVGSFGAGPYGNMLDCYKVKSGTNTVMVFMDMYHSGYVETNTVPGFTIVNR